jgi:hypothetical protein
MRKIEAAMISALRETLRDSAFEGQFWKQANTLVWQNHSGTGGTFNHDRWIEVILYSTTICLIEPLAGRLSLYSGGHRTATTKSRLNAILAEIGDGFYIYQRAGNWELWKGGYFYEDFTEGYSLTLRGL